MKHHPAPSSAVPAMPDETMLAFRIASVATDRVPLDRDISAMIVDRLIDSFAAAMAAISRDDVTIARDIALGHPLRNGAGVFGCGARRLVTPEWAALANAAALGALDLQDGFLGAGVARPSETIPPLLAVAQSQGRSGRDLLRAIATAYEIHIQLARSAGFCARDTSGAARLCIAQVAGLGTLLRLPHTTIVQAVRRAACAGISSPSIWPHALSAATAKIAVEIVDGAMRGDGLANAIKGASGGVLPGMAPLEGDVSLPDAGAPKRAMAESFAHEHAATCAGQAVIDLALRVRDRAGDPATIEKIVLHCGIGVAAESGPNIATWPLRMFAIVLQDGRFHHRDSTSLSRANRHDTVALCRKAELRAGRAPGGDLSMDAAAPLGLGAQVEILTASGSMIDESLAVANAHPLGAHPFARRDYIDKFEALSDGLITPRESARLLEAIQDLPRLAAGELTMLTAAIPPMRLRAGRNGIFRASA